MELPVDNPDDNLIMCDFCGFKVLMVRRIALDGDYDRLSDRALYACGECSEKKENERINGKNE